MKSFVKPLEREKVTQFQNKKNFFKPLYHHHIFDNKLVSWISLTHFTRGETRQFVSMQIAALYTNITSRSQACR